MTHNISTTSTSGDTFAYRSASDYSRKIKSDDTAFGLGELEEFGSLGSIFTVISEPQTEEEKMLLTENKIWGWAKIYKETKPNLIFYKNSLLERYVDIPRQLWKIVNEQIFPALASGFLDSAPLIREATIKVFKKILYPLGFFW